MRRKFSAVVIAAVVVGTATMLVLLFAPNDSSEQGQQVRNPARSTSSSAPTTLPTTTTIRLRRGSLQPVTFAFGGDVHFEKHLRSKLDANPTQMFAPIAGDLSAADIAMVNFEAAITERGTPDPKQYNFRAPERALDALKSAGVDVVTIANNHGRDYGTVGMADTLTAKAAGRLPIVGVGKDAAEAYSPWRAQIKGQNIAIFGASDVIETSLRSQWIASSTQAGIASSEPEEEAQLLAAIIAERPIADTVVVYLHWGPEAIDCPDDRQKQLASSLLVAGADIVVGTHAHRVMGAGRLGAGFVAYGLGNFAFYNESGGSGITGVLTVTATGRDVDAYAWRPARIRGGIPTPLSGEAAAADISSFEQRRACTGLMG